jgi:hypothetical protein
VALVAAAAIACKPVRVPVRALSSEPQISATVVTIQTTLQPANQAYIHAIVIAEGRARSGDQADRWRLFDFDRHQVTFVDSIAKTYYTETIDRIIALRKPMFGAELPDSVPRAKFSSTGEKRVIQGVEATRSLIRVGGYQRELWIGSSPELPPELFSLLYATQPVDPRYAPMTREVDEALLKVRGFPLVDHSELVYGKTKLVFDRTVVKIEQRNVPKSWLNVSRDYREVTAPGERRPPASSPPPSRSTRGAG